MSWCGCLPFRIIADAEPQKSQPLVMFPIREFDFAAIVPVDINPPEGFKTPHNLALLPRGYWFVRHSFSPMLPNEALP